MLSSNQSWGLRLPPSGPLVLDFYPTLTLVRANLEKIYLHAEKSSAQDGLPVPVANFAIAGHPFLPCLTGQLRC
jgi:hypothetical protein